MSQNSRSPFHAVLVFRVFSGFCLLWSVDLLDLLSFPTRRSSDLLRMMPTFPRSPLSFRTGGFPQYGWKAGLSGWAFPDRKSTRLNPSHTVLTHAVPSPYMHCRVGAVAPYCAGPPTGRCTALEGG